MENKKASKKSSSKSQTASAIVAPTEGALKAAAPVNPKTAKRTSPAKSKRATPAVTKADKPATSIHRHSKLATPPPAQTHVSHYDEVALLAYHYWEARNHAHGFAEQDWHRAEQAVRSRRQVATERTGSDSALPLQSPL